MYVFAGQPTLVCPRLVVHGKVSLMKASQILQYCLVCLVRLTWMVYEMEGKWPHSCFVAASS